MQTVMDWAGFMPAISHTKRMFKSHTLTATEGPSDPERYRPATWSDRCCPDIFDKRSRSDRAAPVITPPYIIDNSSGNSWRHAVQNVS